MFFGFKEIEGMTGWAFVLTALLCLAGLFALPVVLFVGAVWALSIYFGRGH